MFERIQLPYSLESLEPFIDAKTMELHSEKHHQAYTDKLNAALDGTEWSSKSIEEILINLDSLPEDKRTVVRNNGGGFLNHNHFFSILKKNDGAMPTGELMQMIEEAFGGFDKFKEEFTKAALGQFGSGWATLAVDENGENPHIAGLPNQDHPLMHKHKLILGLDVWEHAYYLKYQNRRPEYVEAFFSIIDWDKVGEIYKNAKS